MHRHVRFESKNLIRETQPAREKAVNIFNAVNDPVIFDSDEKFKSSPGNRENWLIH